jgi:hypothetical protein
MVTVMWTATALPPFIPGSNFHCFSARTQSKAFHHSVRLKAGHYRSAASASALIDGHSFISCV